MPSTPPNRHLTWAEIKDFTPGLFEVGDWLVPAGAAQTLTDAYPQPGGGLRAFFKPTTLLTTGIGAGERIIGLFAFGTSHRTLGTFAVDYYCVTYLTSDLKPRIYRYDTTDATQTQWTLMKTLSAGTGDSPKAANFQAYVLTAGTKRIHISIGYGHADTGIYAANQADNTATQTFTKIASSGGLGPMAVHQNRLIEAQGSRIYFSGPGNETLTTGYVDVEPQRVLSDIKALVPYAPSDLIVGKEGAAWSAIQGALTDPLIVTMSESHFLGHADQTLADTGNGIAFMEPNAGIWLTGSGSSFSRLDAQLNPPQRPLDSEVAVTIGDLVFYHRWLFKPQGYIWDEATKAWFRSSFGANVYLQAQDRLNDRVYGVTKGATPVIYSYNLNEASGGRAESWTLKTAPLRSGDGRRIEMREIQVFVKSYHASSTVAVTVNGVTITSAALATGMQMVPFRFRTNAEVMDVQVVAASNASTYEAPSLEALRIGYRPQHLSN